MPFVLVNSISSFSIFYTLLVVSTTTGVFGGYLEVSGSTGGTIGVGLPTYTGATTGLTMIGIACTVIWINVIVSGRNTWNRVVI